MLRPACFIALLLAAAGHLSAQVDTTPPKLVAFDFNPKTIDVTVGAQTITVTAHLTDDLSGVITLFGAVGAQFTSPSGAQTQFGSFGSFNLVSGTSLDGNYQTTVTFPQFSEAGAWTVQVFLEDKVSNSSSIDSAALQALGFPATLTVTSTPDTTPPQLVGFSFSPSTIDVSGGPQSVTFLIHATDSPAGVSFGCTPFCLTSVLLSGPSSGQFQAEPDFNATMI